MSDPNVQLELKEFFAEVRKLQEHLVTVRESESKFLNKCKELTADINKSQIDKEKLGEINTAQIIEVQSLEQTISTQESRKKDLEITLLEKQEVLKVQ